MQYEELSNQLKRMEARLVKSQRNQEAIQEDEEQLTLPVPSMTQIKSPDITSPNEAEIANNSDGTKVEYTLKNIRDMQWQLHNHYTLLMNALLHDNK